ncbi:hypothetical protein JKP88DRAFT_278725 [Tribonema minus]|uniref:SWIM-type domain-containing protein n=1 Tax=Tribonema minus TaxID=303371 RepID=A0A835YU83_9STRA|nr:hypothetical protein JKP88DRAFT_278725 [Tribonema minus]
MTKARDTTPGEKAIANKVMKVQIRGEHTPGGVVPRAVDPASLTPSVLEVDHVYNADCDGQATRCRLRRQALARVPAGAALTGRNTMTKKQISAALYRSRKKRRSEGLGTFTGVHAAISKNLYRTLPSGVIILYYKSEPGGFWQIVVTTEKALDVLRDTSIRSFVSDTKHDTCPQKLAFTVIGAVLPGRRGMQPLVERDDVPQARRKPKVKHPMLAEFDMAIRALVTAQSESKYKATLKALLRTVERWGKDGWLVSRSPPEYFVKYLKKSFGKRWFGSTGNYIGQDESGYEANNNSVESSFRTMDACLFFGKRCTSFPYLMEMVLGVTANWKLTIGPSYFEQFAGVLADKHLEGPRWIKLQDGVQLPESLSEHDEPEGRSEWYLVSEMPINICITRSKPERPIAPAAVWRENGCQITFDRENEFNDIFRVLTLRDAPVQHGFYTVGMRISAGGSRIVTCMCGDYYYRGNTHHPCRHAVAALAFKEEQDEPDEAKKEDIVRQQRMQVMSYLKNVEQGRADKDIRLYDACAAANWPLVEHLLKQQDGVIFITLSSEYGSHFIGN